MQNQIKREPDTDFDWSEWNTTSIRQVTAAAPSGCPVCDQQVTRGSRSFWIRNQIPATGHRKAALFHKGCVPKTLLVSGSGE